VGVSASDKRELGKCIKEATRVVILAANFRAEFNRMIPPGTSWRLLYKSLGAKRRVNSVNGAKCAQRAVETVDITGYHW